MPGALIGVNFRSEPEKREGQSISHGATSSATGATVHSLPARKSREGGQDRTGAAGQTVHRRDEPADDRDRDAGGLWQSTPVQLCFCRSLWQTADCDSAHTATGHSYQRT